MSKQRFRIKTDDRVYDGDRFLGMAADQETALMIVNALRLQYEIGQEPSPSSVDGLPEIPDGYQRITADYPLSARLIATTPGDPLSTLGPLFRGRAATPVTQQVCDGRGSLASYRIAASGLVRRVIRRRP